MATSHSGLGQTNRPAGALRKWDHKLFEAVSRGDVERVKEYLDADPTLLVAHFGLQGKPSWSDGWTLLHEAANFDHVEVAEELLRRGARVNARAVRIKETLRGDTPLHVAAARGGSRVVS